MPWAGSFSYKFSTNPAPFILLYANGTRAAGFSCVNLGTGIISFHPVIPGADPNNPEVDVNTFLPVPNQGLFRIERNAGLGDQFIQQNEMPNAFIYEIMWVRDYKIYIDNILQHSLRVLEGDTGSEGRQTLEGIFRRFPSKLPHLPSLKVSSRDC